MSYPGTVDTGILAKTGLAQISGGATQWGIPGLTFSGPNTFAISVNVALYNPFVISYQHTLTAWEFEVTTAPAGAANVRVGLYAADGNCQPTGAPLYDSGSIAVANGFTGIKTAASLSIGLGPGSYLVVTNTDTAMTLRSFVSPTPFMVAALGTSASVKNMFVAQTYGAFPNPGTVWTSLGSTGGAQNNVVAWQWTE